MARARLFVSQLESRENPSITFLDPITGETITIEDPAPVEPVGTSAIASVIDAALAAAASATTTTTTTEPLLDSNGVYNVDLIP